jgi:hypothetical protein
VVAATLWLDQLQKFLEGPIRTEDHRPLRP